MKTFDLDAAKRGAAVCTQYGEPVRIVEIDTSDPIAISADVEITTRKSYYADGTSCEDHFDLMMRDDDYLEKLERGEYAPSVKENLTVENPVVKKNLTTDREYWRRVYAGQIAGGLASHNGLNIIGSEIIIAKASCNIADALIEELEKKGANCSKGSQSSEGITK